MNNRWGIRGCEQPYALAALIRASNEVYKKRKKEAWIYRECTHTEFVYHMQFVFDEFWVVSQSFVSYYILSELSPLTQTTTTTTTRGCDHCRENSTKVSCPGCDTERALLCTDWWPISWTDGLMRILWWIHEHLWRTLEEKSMATLRWRGKVISPKAISPTQSRSKKPVGPVHEPVYERNPYIDERDTTLKTFMSLKTTSFTFHFLATHHGKFSSFLSNGNHEKLSFGGNNVVFRSEGPSEGRRWGVLSRN